MPSFPDDFAYAKFGELVKFNLASRALVGISLQMPGCGAAVYTLKLALVLACG
jgi:hypothetical protein